MSESSQSSFQIRLLVLVLVAVMESLDTVWAEQQHLYTQWVACVLVRTHTHSVVSYGTWVLRRGVRNNDTHCANKKFICVESLPLQSSPRKLFDYNLSVTKSGASHQVV